MKFKEFQQIPAGKVVRVIITEHEKVEHGGNYILKWRKTVNEKRK